MILAVQIYCWTCVAIVFVVLPVAAWLVSDPRDPYQYTLEGGE